MDPLPFYLKSAHRRRDYRKIYADKLDSNGMRKDRDENTKVSFTAIAATLIIKNKLVKKIREKMANRAFSCKKTINNIQPYIERVTNRDVSKGQSLLCIVCNISVLHGLAMCRSCNCVAHVGCLDLLREDCYRHLYSDTFTEDTTSTSSSLKFMTRSMSTTTLLRYNDPNYSYLAGATERSEEDSYSFHLYSQKSRILSDSPETGQQQEFVCNNCEDSAVADRLFLEKIYEKLRKEALIRNCVKIIARLMRTYGEKKRIRKRKVALVKFQAMMRRRMWHLKYTLVEKKLLRVVTMEFSSFPRQYLENTDSSRIILTVIDPLNHGSQLFRSDMEVQQCLEVGYLLPGVLRWCHLVVFTYCTKINVEGSKHYAMMGQCQFFLRDILNFYSVNPREMSLVFKSQIFWVPTDAKGLTRLKTLEKSHTYINQSLLSSSSSADAVLVFRVPNVVGCFCGMVTAPPLDLLRRPPEEFAATKSKIEKSSKKEGSHNARTSQWWLCLMNCQLFFYQYFGDMTPRFVSDVSMACAICSKDAGMTHHVAVLHADKRNWNIEFSDHMTARKFSFALNESAKAFRKEKTMYVFSKILDKHKPYN